ncbi:MAG: phosphodiester glycosidase family protein [Vallitaleaceae bacterium]|nr:phosphodiester glycosidase family protein [Vallitaleaceae bacterium]
MNELNRMLQRFFFLISLMSSLGISFQQIEIDGFQQEMILIKASTKREAFLMQGLSNGQVFGYATLEEMLNDQKEIYGRTPELSVNGVFYNPFGEPEGILIIDGELVRSQSKGSPLFILKKNGDASIEEVSLQSFIKHEGVEYPVYEVNEGLTDSLLAVFTPWYGKTDRIERDHTTYVVRNHHIVEIRKQNTPEKIDFSEGNLHSGDFQASFQTLRYEIPYEVGDELRFLVKSSFSLEETEQAFETGGWLVKNGENVARDFEPYVGYTTSLQPRTVIGIDQEGKVVFLTVDGRREESAGLSGYQIAEELIKAGCISGAYLDGGSSTTVFQGEQLVNQPSMGEMKEISHGLFLYRKTEGQ